MICLLCQTHCNRAFISFHHSKSTLAHVHSKKMNILQITNNSLFSRIFSSTYFYPPAIDPENKAYYAIDGIYWDLQLAWPSRRNSTIWLITSNKVPPLYSHVEQTFQKSGRLPCPTLQHLYRILPKVGKANSKDFDSQTSN